MLDSKFIQSFIALNNEEKRYFKKWILSDFVNKNNDIFRLHRFVETRRNISQKTVSKEKLHEYLYPNLPFNDLRIRHLIWQANEMIEDFIVYYRIQQKKEQRALLLAGFFSERDLPKIANQHIENGLLEMEKTSVRNAAFFSYQYQFHTQYHQTNSKNNRNVDLKFQEIIDTRAQYFILETLKYACIVHSIQKITNIQIQNPTLEHVVNMIEKGHFKNCIPIQIYYHIYLVTFYEDETAFDLFLKEMQKNSALFSMQDLRDVYLLAINFCVKKSNQNIEKYTKLTFDIYIYAIENKFLLEDNEISRFSFTNVVSLGIKLKQLDKTTGFIKKYADLIATEYRQNTIDFNNAKLHYSKKEYEKALKILLTNEFKDTIWNLNAKFILLKIYFETQNLNAFKIQLKAFKIYISRKSTVGYHQEYFTNVVNSFKTLYRIYKNPKLYADFTFDTKTPDADWFNNALQSIKTT
ncbi:MAG: hypothetical protein U0U67_05085 [Chitinophagales bacterium]